MSAIQEANAIQRKLDTADRQHMTALAKEDQRHLGRINAINGAWKEARETALAGASKPVARILEIEAHPVLSASTSTDEPEPDAG